MYLPGIDKQNRSFNIDLIIDPKKYPTAFGADQLKGVFECYAQLNTHCYFQTGLKMFGNITFNNLTEPVIGNGFLSIRVFLRRPVVNIRTNGVKLISRMALICPFGDNLIA